MLTACGIETIGKYDNILTDQLIHVATVLTACGIETIFNAASITSIPELQQCLPLAVLKRDDFAFDVTITTIVATVLTACGIET